MDFISDHASYFLLGFIILYFIALITGQSGSKMGRFMIHTVTVIGWIIAIVPALYMSFGMLVYKGSFAGFFLGLVWIIVIYTGGAKIRVRR
ncbi:hypothetical protein GCM10028809_69930 [Spirosoma gilvum]